MIWNEALRVEVVETVLQSASVVDVAEFEAASLAGELHVHGIYVRVFVQGCEAGRPAKLDDAEGFAEGLVEWLRASDNSEAAQGGIVLALSALDFLSRESCAVLAANQGSGFAVVARFVALGEPASLALGILLNGARDGRWCASAH